MLEVIAEPGLLASSARFFHCWLRPAQPPAFTRRNVRLEYPIWAFGRVRPYITESSILLAPGDVALVRVGVLTVAGPDVQHLAIHPHEPNVGNASLGIVYSVHALAAVGFGLRQMAA